MGDGNSTTPRASKRLREYSSPDSPVNMENEKVGDMTRGQLVRDMMDSLSILLDTKLAALATKEDVHHLSTKIQGLEEENQKLRSELTHLKSREQTIVDKLVDLEGRSRRNNLIFRGLRLPENVRDYVQHVKKFCGEVFGHGNVYVNRAHPLDRDGKAIIAHIPDDSDVQYIMSRVKNLKGTGYSVHRDFPKEVREKRACLAALREEVERKAGRRRMPMVYDHLTIEGSRFTWEDGMLRCGREDGAEKLRTLLRQDFGTFLTSLKDQKPVRSRLPLQAPTANEGMDTATVPSPLG